jgi:hypothetical protein
MKPSFKIGDRVRFNREFLQSTCTYTGQTPMARGTITGFWGYENQQATIKWDHPYFSDSRYGGAHIANLQKVKP